MPRITDIKVRRIAAGLLAWQVAEAVGLTRARYSLIENGHVRPRAEVLARILAAVEEAEAEGGSEMRVVRPTPSKRAGSSRDAAQPARA